MRLIDADELKKQAYKSGDWDKPLVVDVDDIDDAPTVNEWHYPSKGDMPTENGKYLVVWRGEYGEHIDIDQWSDGKWLYIGGVIAWQNIIPPKEEA